MPENGLNIVHMIPSAGPCSFGLGPVALNLAREQISLGENASIWSLDSDHDRQWAASSSGLPADRICGFTASAPHVLRWSRAMERMANDQAARISILQLHALWTGLSRIPNQLRDCHSIPTVITPHGSLQKWALRKSRWKKEVALILYERSNLRNASCFHAVGENEISDIRDFGLVNPVAVIPNGISNDWLQSKGCGMDFRRKYGISANRRIILFLSRITPIKGLPMLLEALDKIRKRFADWCLVIAGADEFNHRAEVEADIEKRGLADCVILPGPLFGQIKRDAFDAAELFVLPSFSEGAPIVILEALGSNVPVLATKASPWPQLESHACGWLTDITANAIAGALEDALSCSPDHLRQMGVRGKKLVTERFTWTTSAEMTIDLYKWLLGKAGRPGFVVVD